MYVTTAQLADLPGALELAQAAGAQHQRPVAAALMQALLRGEDVAAFDAEMLALGQEAYQRILATIAVTCQFIDGFLARRYTLPLSSTPGNLTDWARAIVRYRLRKDQISDPDTSPVVRDYKEAVRFLGLIADGKYSLGLDDPQSAAQPASGVQFDEGRKVFGQGFRGVW